MSDFSNLYFLFSMICKDFQKDSWADKRELMKMEGIWSPQIMFGQICQDANDRRPICFRLIREFAPPSKHGDIVIWFSQWGRGEPDSPLFSDYLGLNLVKNMYPWNHNCFGCFGPVLEELCDLSNMNWRSCWIMFITYQFAVHQFWQFRRYCILYCIYCYVSWYCTCFTYLDIMLLLLVPHFLDEPSEKHLLDWT